MIKYVCDECGKELQTWAGNTVTLPYAHRAWASISITLPPKPVKKPVQSEFPLPAYAEQPTILVCSQSCAEKALDRAKELLRQAFQKVPAPET